MSPPQRPDCSIRRRLASFALALSLLFVPQAPAQTFLQPAVIPTGNWPAAIYSADLNGDGYPDLLYTDPDATSTHATVHVLLNNGHAVFTPSTTLSLPSNVLTLADVDGDGHPDLVWLVSSQATAPGVLIIAELARGNGDGTFAAATTYGSVLTPAQPTTLANLSAGHISSATGILNLAFENTATPTLYVMQAPLGIGYAATDIRPLAGSAGPITIADLNADGLGDVLVQRGSSALDVFLGHTGMVNSIPVTASATFTASAPIHSLLVQPVDNDALPDLVLEGANGRFDIFHGNGDGTFASSSEGGSGTAPGQSDGLSGHGGHLIAETTVAAGVRRNFYTSTPAGISVLTGNGNLTYTLQGIYNAGPGRTSFAFADFNHDGYPDLALDSPEGIAILFGNPDGTLQSSRAFAAGKPAMSGVLGAFTSSRHLDAAVSISSTSAQLLLGQGDGTFVAAPTPTLSQTANPSLWGTIAAADFNQDGNQDLVVTADGAAAALPALGFGVTFGLGHGDGTFNVASLVNTQNNPGGINFFGSSALAPTLGPSGSPGLLVLDQQHLWNIYNLPAPTGLSSTPIAAITDPHAHNLVAAGSLHQGNLPDLIVQDQGSLKLFLNSPTGFASTPAGDLSVDGSLTTPGQLTAPALSPAFNGPAIPVSAGGLGFPAFPGSATIQDLDGDGNNDLIVAYDNLAADHTAPNPASAPNLLYLWFGNGAGKFLTSARHPVNPVRLTPSRNFYQIAIADLNGDRIPDLILSDGFVLSIELGLGDGSFGPEQHLLAGQGLNTISIGDVNGDGYPDLVLANGGTVLSNPVANKELLTPNPDVNTGGITVLLNPYKSSATNGAVVSANPNPAPFEGAYTLTSTLSPSSGTVAFSVDSTPVGSARSQNGTATLPVAAYTQGAPTPPILPGAHTITAAYAGDAPGASPTGSLTVALAPTTVTLSPTTPLSTPYGTPINGTFLITVLDQAYPATGTYTVFDNGVAIPQCTALSLLTSCPYGDPQLLDAGPHTLSVAYNGDPINAASLSNSVPFVITPDATSAALLSSLNPATLGSAVTFTVTVTGSVLTPTGQVQFLDNGALLASANLGSTGTATFTSSTLAVGTHPITVAYAGNQDFQPSTSPILNQVIVPAATPPVTPAGFTLTIQPNPVTLGVGQTALLQVTVTPLGSFAQTVQLTCSGLPSEATCVFIRPLLPTTGGTTTLQLTAASPHDCNVSTPYYPPSTTTAFLRPLAGITLAALCLTGSLVRRRLPRTLWIILFSAALLTALTPITACGHCTDLGTYPGVYTVTVTATPQGAPITTPQAQPITMKVTVQ